MTDSTFTFTQVETDKNDMKFFTFPTNTMLFKGVTDRTNNSAQHINSATFMPNKSSEDFGFRGIRKTKIMLPPQDFVFLATELLIAAMYGWGKDGRIVTYKSLRPLKLFNMADYESVVRLIRCYNLPITDFAWFLKILHNTKTVERISDLETDYEFLHKLTKSSMVEDFDGYVYNLPGDTEKHHPEVVVFSVEKNLMRNNIEYRFTGLGYGGYVLHDIFDTAQRKELHFLLLVNEIGQIVGTHFLNSVISVHDKFDQSHEVAVGTENRDKWLFDLQKLPVESRYDNLVAMMKVLLPKFESVFENREKHFFNLHRFDDVFQCKN